MYDPVALFTGGKSNIKNSEFVVIYQGRETVMTRDNVIKISPRALLKFYESKLAFRWQKWKKSFTLIFCRFIQFYFISLLFKLSHFKGNSHFLHPSLPKYTITHLSIGLTFRLNSLFLKTVEPDSLIVISHQFQVFNDSRQQMTPFNIWPSRPQSQTLNMQVKLIECRRVMKVGAAVANRDFFSLWKCEVLLQLLSHEGLDLLKQRNVVTSEVSDWVQAFVLENAQKMKVFDLLEVVELEIGQNHNIIIAVQDSFLLGLSIEYVPDPAQVTELILE